MGDELVPRESNVLLYTSPKGKVRIEVAYQGETFWLTLNRIAELFGTSKQLVSYHLKNIFEKASVPNRGALAALVTTHATSQR